MVTTRLQHLTVTAEEKVSREIRKYTKKYKNTLTAEEKVRVEMVKIQEEGKLDCSKMLILKCWYERREKPMPLLSVLDIETAATCLTKCWTAITI